MLFKEVRGSKVGRLPSTDMLPGGQSPQKCPACQQDLQLHLCFQVASACQQLLQALGDMRHRCTLLFQDIDCALKASDKMEDADVCSLQDFDPSAGTGILVVVGVPDAEVKQSAKSEHKSLQPARLVEQVGTVG